jgi:hypothetical protein
MTTQEKILEHYRRGFTRKEICQKLNLEMPQVGPIVTAEIERRRTERRRATRREQKRIPGKARTGKVGRCGTCGGKVLLPCQLCKVRGLAATV